MKHSSYLLSILLVFCMATVSTAQLLNADSAWTAEYRGSSSRVNDLVHTRLEVKFDYAKSYLYGKAAITLTPHFYATDSLQLDAKGMDITRIALVKGTAQVPLQYSYNQWILRIKLDRSYRKGEKYTIAVDYTAKPNEVKVKGSSAINDAKGLYFINPTGGEKNKPTQIWTQGETEGTSVWCPTIDKPNQKSTEEIIMTVPGRYVTLSNGRLASQVKNADGTRTDHWKMELPHSPYLFFMAVGEYTIVKDVYKGKEVSYYMRKDFVPVARKIYGNTPKMMAFYEKLTGVPYPWVKYSQITGVDYVSGAMENTTATLHQESAEQDARELVDGNAWESTIAHELFHQWFGDYVTAESWSNLTVNESFADYSEYLWQEHQYGADAAGAAQYDGMTAYLRSSEDAAKHLVRFYYSDREDMFDLVSYQKGGRILNMLRNAVGDSAFFKGLNNYLTTNKFKTGEAHQLRLALEEVSGRDLNWFFDQWYFGAGHPKVTISYSWNESVRKATVSVVQTQRGHVFTIPLAIDVYRGNTKERHLVWLRKARETFIFDSPSKPDLINVDGDKVILWEKQDNKTLENYIFQYSHAGNYADRREAIDLCLNRKDNPVALNFLKTAVRDPYYGLRNAVLESLDPEDETVLKEFEPILLDLAKNDHKSTVRANALDLLGEYRKQEYKSLFTASVNDSSYSVAGAALAALAKVDSVGAFIEAKRQAKTKTKGELSTAISEILTVYGSEEDFDFVAAKYDEMPMSQLKFSSTTSFARFLINIKDLQKFKKGIDLIVKFRNSIPAPYRAQTDAMINQGVLDYVLKQKEDEGMTEFAEYVRKQVSK